MKTAVLKHRPMTFSTLEVGLIGRLPVIVKTRIGSVDQAIHGAVEKLKQAVASVLQKHDRRPAQWPDS